MHAPPGGIVKAAGLGDGPTQGEIAIAKLRLTMPPTTLGDFAFALLWAQVHVALSGAP